jgi:23S rRNA (uridine2552-2'-O)-methyltransferase
MGRYEPHDKFFRRARAQGLPSRAAFKIEELLTRFKLVHPGSRVLDLGCAPGGWLAIMGKAAGDRGRIVGIDLVRCAAPAPNIVTIAGDLRDREIQARAIGELGGPADLITSDLAPKLSGIRERDQARARELLETALATAESVLRPQGALVAKLFMGADFDEIRQLFSKHFVHVDVVRTKATRPGSSELYLVARDFRRLA